MNERDARAHSLTPLTAAALASPPGHPILRVSTAAPSWPVPVWGAEATTSRPSSYAVGSGFRLVWADPILRGIALNNFVVGGSVRPQPKPNSATCCAAHASTPEPPRAFQH